MTAHELESNDSVSPREFYKAIAEVKALLLAELAAMADTQLEQHRNIRSALNENFQLMSSRLDASTKEFREVEHRVTMLEEAQKRNIWIMTFALPSTLAAWEWLKHLLKLQ